MSDVEGLAEVLGAHWRTTIDMGTPRQYTGHGGWNVSCECGHLYGSQQEADDGEIQHLASIVAASVQAARAEALEEAADEVLEPRAARWLRARAAALRADDAGGEGL